MVISKRILKSEMKKRVSVIVPLYLHERFLFFTINSLKNQTYLNFEVILVDNASPDNSARVARRMIRGDNRFTLIREPQVGLHHALNTGVSASSGEIICFMDDDDIYYPDRLSKTISFFSDGKADLVACRGHFIDASGHVFSESEVYRDTPETLPLTLFRYNVVLTMSFISIRRDLLKRLLPFPESANRMPDYYLMLGSTLEKASVSLANEVLVGKRYHGCNVALDWMAMSSQTVPALLNYWQQHPQVHQFYGRTARRNLFSRRYLDSVQYMRRNDLVTSIPGYLKEYVAWDWIAPEFYFLFNALSILKSDPKRLSDFLKRSRIRHPFFYYVSGLKALREGDVKTAISEFKETIGRTPFFFVEAEHNLGVSESFHSESRARRRLRRILNTVVTFQDAWTSLRLLDSEPGKLRPTEFLSSPTLELFLNSECYAKPSASRLKEWSRA